MADLTGQQLKNSYQNLVTIDATIESNPTSGQLENGLGNPITALGIGTDAPIRPLSIEHPTSSQISFEDDYTGSPWLFGVAGDNSGKGIIYSASNIDFQIYTNNNPRLTVDGSGNVGIGGTAGDGYRLQLLGSSEAGNTLGMTYTGVGAGAIKVNSSGALEFGLDASDGGTERMRINSSGNVGIGVTPSAWAAPFGSGVLEFGGGFIAGSSANNVVRYGLNSYYNGSNYIYKANGNASAFLQNSGQFQFYTAPSGTAGNTISFTQAMTLDSSGNLLIGTDTTPTSSAGNIVLKNGTAPTGNATDGIILYAEDVSTSSELKVRDEAGNVTTLSPHNFSLIPDGASEEMAWAYYSERDGKKINVDMLKLARMVESLTGEKLVYEQ